MEQNANPGMPMTSSTGKKPKNGNGLKIATAVACCAAICGIGFGIYGMVQSSQKDNQISDLKVQISGSSNNLSTSETGEINTPSDSQIPTASDSAAKKQNPVIAATAPKHYSISFDSPRFQIGSNNYYVKLGIVDGGINSCELYTHNISWVGQDMVETDKFDKDCGGINNLPGKIYKAVIVGEGQEASSSSVGFIMEDGTVSYVPAADLVKETVSGGVASIKGTLKIDGFVVDAFTVDVSEDGATGGYVTTIFVLSDGTYVKYDNSMLN